MFFKTGGRILSFEHGGDEERPRGNREEDEAGEGIWKVMHQPAFNCL